MHATVPPTPRPRPRWLIPGIAIAAIVVAVCAIVSLAVIWNSGRSSDAGAAAPAAGSSTEPTSTPTSSASAPATTSTDYRELCAANGAAAKAKQGTVADDLAATHRQSAAIRALLPMKDVPAEVAAGGEVFAASTDELIGILQSLPAQTLVSDVPIETFTDTQAMKAVGSDPNYQAFIGWTIETCGGSLAG
ncbi:hypothetical protein [Microbacterium hominis]|uniref:Uncharacterized protein n=1 Tax=Microbacterium hominis TaxID=162426 RepID=A0A0B4D0C5_9MICO|nr:hypothetical protein [Microbacterium hominis]KIC60106.1 hypothetical protein RM52_01475 [Microbacterium hominis]